MTLPPSVSAEFTTGVMTGAVDARKVGIGPTAGGATTSVFCSLTGIVGSARAGAAEDRSRGIRGLGGLPLRLVSDGFTTVCERFGPDDT